VNRLVNGPMVTRDIDLLNLRGMQEICKAAISRRTSGLGGPSTVDSMDPCWL
jgi:hypothetical protein